MRRLALVVLFGLAVGCVVAGSMVVLQAAIAAANQHFETLDVSIDP